MTCADTLYRVWMETVTRRDDACKAAYDAQWARFAPKIEEARARYMEALKGDRGSIGDMLP
jgi:hypothetical protein